MDEQPDIAPDHETAPNGAVYKISSLRDIFNLPSHECMERCLAELPRLMLQARATNDLFVALMREKGSQVEQAFAWPDVTEWTDDGKGEIGADYVDLDGKTILSMRTVKNPSPGGEPSPLGAPSTP
jgi:hypothetical protein